MADRQWCDTAHAQGHQARRGIGGFCPFPQRRRLSLFAVEPPPARLRGFHG